MQISREGLALLTRLEGTRAFPYADSAGLLTTGVGHLITRSELSSGKLLIDGVSVRYGAGLTEAQMTALLRQDLAPVEAAVNGIEVPLKQCQYDTLCLFIFNIGIGAFLSSTLLKKLRAGDYDEAPVQLARWVHAGGKVVRGLVRRREQEIALWNQVPVAGG